jgi:hypothetical protein
LVHRAEGKRCKVHWFRGLEEIDQRFVGCRAGGKRYKDCWFTGQEEIDVCMVQWFTGLK